MAAVVTFVTRQMVEAYVKGDLGQEEATAVRNVLKEDCRAQSIARKVRAGRGCCAAPIQNTATKGEMK